MNRMAETGNAVARQLFSTEKPLWMYPEIKSLATALFHQQLWCWGRDILHPSGNALLRYGFTRQRPPADGRGSSEYGLQLCPQRRVTLWGFGLLYGDASAGGLFLKRYGFAPRLLELAETPAHIWQTEQLPALRAPRSLQDRRCAHLLLKDALRWVADYEKWARQELGLAYRQRCLQDWQKAVAGADEIAGAWENLAQLIESNAINRANPVLSK